MKWQCMPGLWRSRGGPLMLLTVLTGVCCVILALSGTALRAHAQHDSQEAASAAQADASGGPAKLQMKPIMLLMFTFLIAVFLGVELITKVPSQLHTPLMSGSNAISGITIVGAILAAGQGRNSMVLLVLGGLAMVCAMINVAGGYLVTDRMLRMFKAKEGSKK